MVLISLQVEEKIKNDVKRLGVTHAGCYLRGWRVLTQPDPREQFEQTIKQWEHKTEKLSNLLDHYVRKSILAEDKIKELEAKLNVLDKRRPDKNDRAVKKGSHRPIRGSEKARG